MMLTIGISLAVYLALGLMFLIAFEAATKRIRTNLKDATAETQVKIAGANQTISSLASIAAGPSGYSPTGYIGKKTAAVALLVATWFFWPAFLVGIIRGSKKGEKDAQ